MKNEKKDRLAGYLLWSFGIAWFLQIAAGMMFRAGVGLAYSALLAVSMFAPLLAAVLSGAGIKGMGWTRRFRIFTTCWEQRESGRWKAEECRFRNTSSAAVLHL